MSKNTTLMLVVGFVAGCGAAAMAPLLIPPAHAQTTQRWEAHCVYHADNQPDDTAAWLTSTGNTAGGQGWELAGLAAGPHPGFTTICFKRPAP